jgi:hypothetical protein
MYGASAAPITELYSRFSSRITMTWAPLLEGGGGGGGGGCALAGGAAGLTGVAVGVLA